MRDYYDGYRFSVDTDIKVYNPVSVGMFFTNSCRFNNYWESTGVSTLAVEMAKRYDLVDIMEKEPGAGMASFTSFDIADIVDGNLNKYGVYALLYYTGYLTIDRGNNMGLYLKFPNKEISTSFSSSLITRYMKKGNSLEYMVFRANDAIRQGDTEEFIAILKEYYEAFPYDLLDKDKEKTYQLLFHAFFVASGMDAIAEDHSLRGRADNVIKTKSHIYICELKVDGSVKEALAQIKERKYYEKYLPLKTKGMEIHLIGINFSSEERNIKCYKEELV